MYYLGFDELSINGGIQIETDNCSSGILFSKLLNSVAAGLVGGGGVTLNDLEDTIQFHEYL